MLLLDVRLGLLAGESIATCNIAHVSVEPREVFTLAVAASARSLVHARNHPSGDPERSAPDVDLTPAMADARRVLGIEVVDHLIVSSRCYYSFRRAGRP